MGPFERELEESCPRDPQEATDWHCCPPEAGGASARLFYFVERFARHGRGISVPDMLSEAWECAKENGL